jgi:hypothetical protein
MLRRKGQEVYLGRPKGTWHQDQCAKKRKKQVKTWFPQHLSLGTKEQRRFPRPDAQEEVARSIYKAPKRHLAPRPRCQQKKKNSSKLSILNVKKTRNERIGIQRIPLISNKKDKNFELGQISYIFSDLSQE